MSLVSYELFLSPPLRQQRSRTAKRILDLSILGLAALPLVPLALIIAAAIKLTSRGPVLFVQTRIGEGGVPFRMYKFRSMIADAERRRSALLATSDRDGICFKSRRDPRVTTVGRFLRRTSLDERLSVPAGISGLWQVSGRAEIGFPEMVALDIDYARNADLLTDLKIIFRTFTAVATGRGAY